MALLLSLQSLKNYYKSSVKEDILKWLKNGADLLNGVRLYLKHSKNEAFKLLVSDDPSSVQLQLFDALVRLGEIDDITLIASQRRYLVKVKFRQEWTFFSNQTCPSELKILAADKITAWHNYVQSYNDLNKCNTLDECYATASLAVENFIENDSIKKEFDFYTQHNHVLGHHRIFASQKRIEELKKLGPIGLALRKKQLEHTVWRVKTNIAKNIRPDLQIKRQSDLAIKEAELREIEKLITLYV